MHPVNAGLPPAARGCRVVKRQTRSLNPHGQIGRAGHILIFIVQELCESRGGRPGLSVLTSLLVSVDVKIY